MTIMGDDATVQNAAGASNNPKKNGVNSSAVPPSPAGAAFAPGTPEPIIIENNPPPPTTPLPQTPPAPIIEPLPRDLPPPAPKPAATPITPAPPANTAIQSDIAKILGGVKLPERHNQPNPGQEQKQKFDTTLADPTRDVPHAPMQPTLTPNPEAPTKSGIVSLHTLKDDLQHVVKENKISYVRAVALEEEKRHRIEERSPAPKMSRRSMFTLFIVIVLIGTGLLAIGAVFMVMQQRSADTSTALRSNILFAEQSVPFPVDNESPGDIRRTLASARNSSSLTLGAILQILPMRTITDPSTGEASGIPLTFGEFLTALGTRAPAELARAVEEDFFFGIHTVDENAPVIVVPVTSYERAFAAMLAWEPYMNLDLEPLFTLMPAQVQSPDGTLSERTFEDTVMRNYDVRALKDDQGQIQLYYSFPTRNVLIIAESPYSFTEILSRLRADRRL